MNKQILFFSACILFLSVVSFSSCDKGAGEKSGCTDPTANNFDPDATVDDGSCTHDSNFPGNFVKANYTEIFHKTYGGSGNNDDELTSGMITDASGNTYFSLNTNDASANNNILIGKITSDGTLAWAKEWDGNFDDVNPDSGGNGETGGTANSISMDSNGDIYVVGESSDVSQNNIYSLLVLKINPSDGSLLWEKEWKHNWPSGSPIASQDARGSGIDASGDYVYVTGSNGEGEMPLVALDKSTGALFFEMTIDITAGTKSYGNVVKADASGNVYIGGIIGSQAHLTKVTAANTASPALAWVKHVDIGFAARFNGIDIDGSDIYLSCDRRGATTFFSFIKMDSDGNVLWGKTFPGTAGDRNNTHSIRVVGNSVYIGGRTGQSGLDTNKGDGLFVKVSKADGSLEWSAIYFTGTAGDVLAEHRIKGISVVGNDVYVVGQVYGGNSNFDHFYGDWITETVSLEDYNPSVSDMTVSSTSDPANGEVRDAGGAYGNANSAYTFQDATAKSINTAPDGDMFITKINLQ